MLVYTSDKNHFQNDVLSNDIENIILDNYKEKTGRNTAKSEIASWKNSLTEMFKVLSDSSIPDDAGIAIEYHIPQSSKRVDFIITGHDDYKNDSVVLIELKQWDSVKMTDKDGIVVTRLKGGEVETAHPSYQVWSYKRLLENFNETVEEEKILLNPCAYLHNYKDDGIISNVFYKEYLEKAPIFLRPDTLKLREFIKKNIKYGDKNKIMYRIDNGRIRPSKSLADQLVGMISGNNHFVMIDEQKIVYENAVRISKTATESKKKVLIVKGGPGTGKSVVAVNLLVELTKQKLSVKYITKNSAPREVYEAMLTGSLKKSEISNMFGGTGSYHDTESNQFDVLLVDEAHRLNAKSGLFSNLGENQIKEIIDSAKASIFFIDEDQKVTLKDIGDIDEIKRCAKMFDCEILEMELSSQFRCNGSNGYLAWLDDVLQIRDTANETLEGIDFDFRVFDDPKTLHDFIIEKNKIKNKARMVAGYCWKWISKKDPSLFDIVINDYKARWNLNSHGQKFIIQPDSVTEVGCIHTCQGLEVDYVGVIVGKDLIVREGKIITSPKERGSTDKSVHGWKKRYKFAPDETMMKLDSIIKNTYRTLMTRGMKGCYVYFEDKETSDYFKKILQKNR